MMIIRSISFLPKPTENTAKEYGTPSTTLEEDSTKTAYRFILISPGTTERHPLLRVNLENLKLKTASHYEYLLPLLWIKLTLHKGNICPYRCVG